MATEQQLKFFEACHSNDVEQVRLILLEGNVDVNSEVGKRGERLTPLKIACFSKYIGLIKLLIDFGADLNHTGSLGCTALCFIINRTGNAYNEVIDLLLQQNIDITTLNSDKQGTFETVLHYAFVSGKTETVKKILNHGISKYNYTKSYKQYYQLILTMINDDLKEFENILAKTDVKPFSSLNEENILYYAMSLKKKLYIKKLLDKGVDPSYGYSRSLFCHAIENNQADILELFFDYGYTGLERLVRPSFEYKKSSILTELVISSNLSRILRLLLEKGDFDVNAIGDDGQTILFKACLIGSSSIVKILLEFNADPNCVTPNLCTSALHVAAKYRDLNFVESLVSHGANLQAVDAKGRTILHAAAENRTTSLPLEYFLKMDIFDVNCQDLDGNTPLHGTISESGSTIGYVLPDQEPQYRRATPGCSCANFWILLKYGANESIKNNNHKTPSYSRDLDDTDIHDDCHVLNYFIKLRLLGYKINENSLVSIHNYTKYDAKVGNVELYEKELEILKNAIIHFFPKTSLYDILFMKFYKLLRHLNNETLLRIYNNNNEDFEKVFPYYGYFLNKKCRQGFTLRDLQDSGKNFLIKALGKSLPDPIYEEILRYVPNWKLKALENYEFSIDNDSMDLQDQPTE